jgi:hypothetical protein
MINNPNGPNGFSIRHKKSLFTLLSVLIMVFLIVPMSFPFSGEIIAESKKIIYVSDYGAVPDGVTDSYIPLRNAVTAARNLDKPVQIVFDAGVYRIGSSLKADRTAFNFFNDTDITITGVDGRTFLTMSDATCGVISINYCENMTISNIIVDYDPLPFTQGTILAVDRKNFTVDLKIDDGYRSADDYCFNKMIGQAGRVINGSGNQITYNQHELIFDPATEISTGVYRLQGALVRYNKDNTEANRILFSEDNIQVGDRFCYYSTKGKHDGILIENSKNTSLFNVTFYASPLSAIKLAMNEGVMIDHLKVQIKPGSDRLLSVNQDGIYACGDRKGITIENSIIAGNGRDAINLNTKTVVIETISGAAKLKYQNSDFSKFKVGDILQVVRQGEIIDTLKVNAYNFHEYELTLDKFVTSLHPSKTYANPDLLVNLSACCQNSVLRNNFFGMSPGSGIVLSSYDVLIENNSFIANGNPVIRMAYETYYKESPSFYREGPTAFNITIRGNTFTGTSRMEKAMIYAFCIAPWSRNPIKGYHPIKNVMIQNNQFVNPNGSLVHLNGADDFKFFDNHATTASNFHPSNDTLLILENSTHVQIKNFTISDQSQRSFFSLHIKDDMESGSNGVSVENMQVSVAGEYKGIFDERPFVAESSFVSTASSSSSSSSLFSNATPSNSISGSHLISSSTSFTPAAVSSSPQSEGSQENDETKFSADIQSDDPNRSDYSSNADSSIFSSTSSILPSDSLTPEVSEKSNSFGIIVILIAILTAALGLGLYFLVKHKIIKADSN